MDITPASIQNFFTRLNFQFQNAFAGVPTFWSDVATEFPSDTGQNLYPFLSMIPGLREWVGPRVINNVAQRAYAVPNKHWEATYGIDRNQFEDDTYGFYAQMQPMIAQQVAEWRDRRLAQVIEAGTTAVCWDGQFFFDTDHPVDPDNSGAGTNSNKLVGAGFDIAVADPLVPYAAARAAMALWKREDGQQMGTLGDTIMCHPNEEKFALQVANALVTAQAVGSAAAGVTNVFSQSGPPRVIVNPYLTVTSGKPWYLLCTKRGIKPFGWQNRQAPNLVARTQVTDENVFKLRQFEWGVDLRGEGLYTFPFLAFRMSAS
jgi:phage major head subunit gpT-like protein